MRREWREYEKLVHSIEKVLAPKGALVKSPDHIKDLESGRLREVDVSIRFNIGSHFILITVECRKRKTKGGSEWIEQLITKRRKIGADKTIAISALGFTEPARITAEKNNIEIYSLEEINEEAIKEWYKSGVIDHVQRKFEANEVLIKFADNLFERKTFIKEFDSIDKVFQINGKEILSLNEILTQSLPMDAIYQDMEPNSDYKEIDVTINFKDDDFVEYFTDDLQYRILYLKLKLKFWLEEEQIPFSRISSLSKNGKEITQNIEFKIESPLNTYNFYLIRDNEKHQVKIIYDIDKK